MSQWRSTPPGDADCDYTSAPPHPENKCQHCHARFLTAWEYEEHIKQCAFTPRPKHPTRIITVTEPGYDVVLFFNEDGGAEAVITRPGLAPIGVNIAPPIPGRRIVIERRNGTFEVMYRDMS